MCEIIYSLVSGALRRRKWRSCFGTAQVADREVVEHGEM